MIPQSAADGRLRKLRAVIPARSTLRTISAATDPASDSVWQSANAASKQTTDFSRSATYRTRGVSSQLIYLDTYLRCPTQRRNYDPRSRRLSRAKSGVCASLEPPWAGVIFLVRVEPATGGDEIGASQSLGEKLVGGRPRACEEVGLEGQRRRLKCGLRRAVLADRLLYLVLVLVTFGSTHGPKLQGASATVCTTSNLLVLSSR